MYSWKQPINSQLNFKTTDNVIRKVYFGTSMNGTFQIADFLIINKCDLRTIQTGDVVAFSVVRKKCDQNDPVVHRMIRAGNDHFITRGDNNRRPDLLPVTATNFIGKVIAFERNGKKCKVRGGMAGLFLARMGYVYRKARHLLICRVRKFLLVKKTSEMISFLWKPQVQKIQFSSAQGPLIKWIYRNRTIATWLPEKNLLRTSCLSRLLIRSNLLN